MQDFLIRQFWRMERAAPAMRTALWRAFYNCIAWLIPDREHHFMNWGYVALAREQATRPVVAPTPLQRNVLALYAHTLGDLDLRGCRVLEVGSGRGGGAAWIARTQGVYGVLGVELSPAAVKLSRESHAGTARLDFVQGCASALPAADGCVDVLLNVESCHHYPDMPRFLSEVNRVLAPGGHFCLADYREAHELADLDAMLATSGMQLLNKRDITRNVVAALEQDHAAKEAFLKARVAWPLRALMRTFFGNPGTEVHASFVKRAWVYQSWVFQKPLPTGERGDQPQTRA